MRSGRALGVRHHDRHPAVGHDKDGDAVGSAARVGRVASRDPAVADYPYTGRVSPTWFKLGFPLSYWSDVLETAAVLVQAGFGTDPRVVPVLSLIIGKQDAHGRWRLENSLNGKMWVDIERRGKPSKWVTLRVLRVLQQADRAGNG